MARVKFTSPKTHTWNPVDGCKNACRYCVNADQQDSAPRLVGRELARTFKPKERVYAFGPSDIWGDWVPDEWIEAVIAHIEKFPRTVFLFLTKNPARYLGFQGRLPLNVCLGATIESNRAFPEISKANPPAERLHSMIQARSMFPQLPRVIAVEPVMDFDLAEFVDRLREIEPLLVYIGYNSSRVDLPEPSLEKTRELIARLSEFTLIRQKTIRQARWER